MNIYVGNLSFDETEASLESAFAAHGEVTSARIITDRETGRSRGFGFVEMSDRTQAQAATSARTIDVIEAYRAGDPMNCVNVVQTRVGAATITIRHFDRVGVLAGALEVLRKADINVQTMANKVFEGSNAAMAIIDVTGEVTVDVTRQLAALDNVIQVQTRGRQQ